MLIDFVMHEQTLHYGPGVFWVVVVSYTEKHSVSAITEENLG